MLKVIGQGNGAHLWKIVAGQDNPHPDIRLSRHSLNLKIFIPFSYIILTGRYSVREREREREREFL